MKLKIAIYTVAFILIFVVCYLFDLNYKYSHLKDYLEVLVGVSSMIFTLMGIWIAFLYPNALRRIADPKKIEHADFTETLQDTRRLEGLVGSVMKSAFVVLTVMLIFLMRTILSDLPLSFACAALLKAAALSVVMTLTFLQVESIFYVIYSNILFINELHNKREDREADKNI